MAYIELVDRNSDSVEESANDVKEGSAA